MKKTLLFLIILLIVQQIHAQVRDISVTFSPRSNYTWWNNQAGLENDLGFGANVGFGFGEFVELRVNYLQLKDVATSFENYGLPNYDPTIFQSQNVDVKSWGFEVKTNLGTKTLTPYLLFGTGIQTLQVAEINDSKQVYTDLGAGLKLNFGHRTTFTVDARNTSYIFNAVDELLTDQNKIDFGINAGDYEASRLGNWSFNTSLQFYLGGTKPEEMSAMDRAYRSYYQHGFAGSRWVIEPAVSHIKFDDESDFRNTYLIGAYTGVDFSEYVGIRVFYLQATNDNTINFSDKLFDNLSIYGLEFNAKFNTSMGVTPYVTLGGGFIDASDDYVTKTGVDNPGDLFSSGGVGLIIPLGKKVELFGGGKYLITSAASNSSSAGNKDILTHRMFDVGLKFSLGKKAESPVEALEREKAKIRASEQKTYQQKLDEMKLMYLEEIVELESELEAAEAEGDSVRSAQIAADKQKAESTYNTLNGAKTRTDSVPSGEILMRITPEQLERLIRTILEGVKEMKPEVEKIKMNADSTTISEQGYKIDSLNSRINRLEKKLVDLDTSQQVGVQRTSAQLTEQGVNDETLEKLEQLQKDYENLSKDVEQIDEKVGIQPQQAQQPVVINAGQPQQSSEPVILTQTTNEDGTQKVEAVEVDDLKEGTFDFSGVSPMIGFNLGGTFTFNIGVRAHMPIQSSKLEFTPEFFYGFGNKNSIGVIGNIVYPLTLKESKLKPYGGAGIGIWKIDGKSNLGLNLLAGTYFDLLEGKLFTDVSLRGLKHVQIGIGYTFDF